MPSSAPPAPPSAPSRVAFVTAGVEATGLRDIMGRLDLTRVPDRLLPGLPVLSEGASLCGRRGAHRGQWTRQWLEKELAPWPATYSSRAPICVDAVSSRSSPRRLTRPLNRKETSRSGGRPVSHDAALYRDRKTAFPAVIAPSSRSAAGRAGICTL